MISALLQILLFSISLNCKGNLVNKKEPIHIRINQVGYHPSEHKSAIIFSHAPVKERFELIEEKSGATILTIKSLKTVTEGWGTYKYYYKLDFMRQ